MNTGHLRLIRSIRLARALRSMRSWQQGERKQTGARRNIYSKLLAPEAGFHSKLVFRSDDCLQSLPQGLPAFPRTAHVASLPSDRDGHSKGQPILADEAKRDQFLGKHRVWLPSFTPYVTPMFISSIYSVGLGIV